MQPSDPGKPGSPGKWSLANAPGFKRLASDGAWVVFGQILSAVGAIVVTRLLTEFVVPSIFGAANLWIGICTLGLNLVCQPMLQASARYYSDQARENAVGRLRWVVFTHLSRWLAPVMGLSLAIGIFCLCTGRAFGPYLILPGLLAVDCLRSIELVLLSAARRQKPYAILVGLDGILRVGLAVGCALLFGATVEAVLIGYLLGSLTGYLLLRIFVRREGVLEAGAVQPDAPETKDLSAKMLACAAPLIPFAFVAWVTSISDRYIIAGMVDLAHAGIYAAAYGLASRPILMISGAILLTLRPVYFNALAAKDAAKARRVFRMLLGATFLAGALVVVLVFFFGPQISGLLLGAQYRGAADLMPWIALGYLILGLANVFSTKSLGYERTVNWTISETICAVATLVTVPFILWFGFKGAAYAVPVYFSIQCFASWILSRRLDQ